MICNTLAVKTMNHESATSDKISEKVAEVLDEFNWDSFDSDAIMVTIMVTMLTKFGMYLSFVQHANSRY
jgi:hypothetical protein